MVLSGLRAAMAMQALAGRMPMVRSAPACGFRREPPRAVPAAVMVLLAAAAVVAAVSLIIINPHTTAHYMKLARQVAAAVPVAAVEWAAAAVVPVAQALACSSVHRDIQPHCQRFPAMSL